MRRILLATVLISFSTISFSQAPYSEMQALPVEALSDQQVADLKAGRGMGLALAAKLNGYPGPSHVLEWADKLDLSPDQRAIVQSFFNSMKSEALPIGNKLIQQESDLDQLFATRTITPAGLASATATIAVTQGLLRKTHLKYHLSPVALLNKEIIML